MAITPDNQTRKLHAYNMLLGAELRQVTKPKDEAELRYFVVGTAVYDVYDFKHFEGLWETDKDRRVALHRLPGGTEVLLGWIQK